MTMFVQQEVPVFIVGTKEYVKAEVENSVDLTSQPVAIVLDGTSYTATWVGTTGPTRTCRTVTRIDFASWDPKVYALLVNFTDSPEEPLVHAGYVSVQAAS